MDVLARDLWRGFCLEDMSEKARPHWRFQAPFVHAVIVLYKSDVFAGSDSPAARRLLAGVPGFPDGAIEVVHIDR